MCSHAGRGGGFRVAIVVVAMVAHPAVVRADYESVAFGVQLHGSYPRCPGDSFTLDIICCDLATYIYQWKDTFGSSWFGFGYDEWFYWTNSAVDRVDWIPNGDATWKYGTDWADVILFVGHGGRGKDNTGKYRSFLRMGDAASGGCDAEISKMSFGNGGANNDANIFLNFGCHNAQYSVYVDGGYSTIRGSNQFSIYNGFHGTHLVSLWEVWQFDDYLDNTENNDVGKEWILQFWDVGVFGDDQTCPVSMAYASDLSEAYSAYTYTGFRDFKATGSGQTPFYIHTAGCDPAGGDPLPY